MAETNLEFEMNPIEEEEEEEVKDVAEEEEKIEETVKKIELDFSMDPIERLNIEVGEVEDSNAKEIGAYLLEQFLKDEPLKEAYRTRKMTLESVNKEITRCAKEKLGGKNGRVSDAEVFGWVLHFVQDGKNDTIETNQSSYQISKIDEAEAKRKALVRFEEEELKRLKKVEEKKRKAEEAKLAKDKKKAEEVGQISLFDC